MTATTTMPGPRIAWMLLLPVLAIFLVAPPALGTYAASRDSSRITAPGESTFPPLPPGVPVEVGVVDYATRAVWDEGRSLDGRTVRLTGFATPTEAGDGWYLTRIALSCCAADGRAYKIEVTGAPSPGTDQWVELTGQWVPGGGTLDDEAIPIIRATDLTPVDVPRNPYE